MKKFIYLLFLSLALLSSADAKINNNSISDYTESTILNIISINNFEKVDNQYYRGAQPNIYDIECLDKLGVKTIINLRNEKPSKLSTEKLAALRTGINYINIPMNADTPPTQNQIEQFFKVINNPVNTPVFVHCMQGKDRTGVMTALYRFKNYNWSFDKAYREMRKMGYHVYAYPKQKSFLSHYIKNSFASEKNQ